VKLDPDIHAARNLEQARRTISVKSDFGIGIILGDDDVMSRSELDDVPEEIQRCN
jgi:hypothetical protein